MHPDTFLTLTSLILNNGSYIILSMFLLYFMDTLKMGFYDTLLSPVLSDSFGLSLTVSSYFFLALGIPRVLGTVLVWA